MFVKNSILVICSGCKKDWLLVWFDGEIPCPRSYIYSYYVQPRLEIYTNMSSILSILTIISILTITILSVYNYFWDKSVLRIVTDMSLSCFTAVIHLLNPTNTPIRQINTEQGVKINQILDFTWWNLIK